MYIHKHISVYIYIYIWYIIVLDNPNVLYEEEKAVRELAHCVLSNRFDHISKILGKRPNIYRSSGHRSPSNSCHFPSFPTAMKVEQTGSPKLNPGKPEPVSMRVTSCLQTIGFPNAAVEIWTHYKDTVSSPQDRCAWSNRCNTRKRSLPLLVPERDKITPWTLSWRIIVSLIRCITSTGSDRSVRGEGEGSFGKTRKVGWLGALKRGRRNG